MKKLLSFLLASAALLPAAAHAQSEPAPAEDDIILAHERRTDIVVVASGVEELPENVGRAVTLIERGEIERRQAVVVSDLLATVPGVTVSRNGGVGGFTGVRIRGAEDTQTLVLIDGVRVNDPSAPGAGFDFGNLLAGAIKRIEVLRGPNSVVWGSQAIGGVVNLVTQDRGWGTSLRGNAEYGGADSISANGALTTGSERLWLTMTAGYNRTDGISAAANGSEADGYRQFGGSAAVKAQLAPGVTLDLRGYYADSRTELDGFPPPAYAFADTAEYSTAQELYGHAGLSAELGPVDSRIAFTIADIDRDNFDPAAGRTPVFFGRGRSERYEYRGDAGILAGLRAVFGAEHEDSRFTDGSVTASTGVTSGYAQLIASPVEAVSIAGGVRHDDHRTFGGHSSFGLSIAARPAYGTVLRAAYGEGFKAPTLYQLYSFYGTPGLRPETAVSYEFGAEQALLGGALTLGATWFHRETEDQIDFDLATFTYSNIARTRAEGIEVEAVARPIEGLSLRASYTHVMAENRSAGPNLGNALARRPRDAGSLSGDYAFGFGLSVGGTVLVVGDSFDDAGNLVRLEGYTLASVRAEMPLGERVSVYGRVENVADERYRTVAGYGTPGRAAHAGVRLRFE